MNKPKYFPTELEILGYTWKVLYIEGTSLNKDDPDEEVDGYMDIARGEISINLLAGNRDRIREILFHEILEAIHCLLDMELEHRDLSNLSVGIHQVFRDNDLLKGL